MKIKGHKASLCNRFGLLLSAAAISAATLLFAYGNAIMSAAPALAADSDDQLRQKMIAQAKQEGGELIVLGPSNRAYYDRLIPAFKEKYPFINIKNVDAVSSAIVNRVMQESRAGRMTVDLLDSESSAFAPLQTFGVLQPFEWPHREDFEPNSQPSDSSYVLTALVPYMPVAYNPTLVSVSELPNSYEEIASEKYKGKTALLQNMEQMPLLMAHLWSEQPDQLNWDRSKAFFEKIAKNQKPRIGTSPVSGAQLLSQGAASYVWFVPPSSFQLMAGKGAPIELRGIEKMPSFSQGYAIVKGAPHPATAWLLVDYIMSPQGQFEFTDKVYTGLPLNNKAKYGRLAEWISERAPIDRIVTIPPDKFNDVFNNEQQKISQQFFHGILGMR